MVLIAVTHADSEADANLLASKIAGLRVFPDQAGLMNLSVEECNGGVLVVSQFTLYGDVRRGRRPSFTAAAPPEQAEPLIGALCRRLRETGLKLVEGTFGANMQVTLTNDGPVTVILETRDGQMI